MDYVAEIIIPYRILAYKKEIDGKQTSLLAQELTCVRSIAFIIMTFCSPETLKSKITGAGYRHSTPSAKTAYRRENPHFSPRDRAGFESVDLTSVFLYNLGKERRRNAMPRMSKKRKMEWAFFLNERNRITYNKLCLKCQKDCKQSFRSLVIQCPNYRRKESSNGRSGNHQSKRG